MAMDWVKGWVTAPQTITQYTYVLNNPILYVDPSGMILQLFGGTEEQRAAVLSYMNTLSCDTLSVDQNGIILIVGRAVSPELSAGTELIRRIVDNHNFTAVVGFDDDNGFFTVPNETTAFVLYHKSFSRRPGSGSGTKILFDPFGSVEVPTTGADGIVRNEDTPLYIALAHELIHADRAMRGVWISGFRTDHRYRVDRRVGFLGIHYSIYETVRTPDEELAVIGLRYNRSEDITENQIHSEHGLPLRGAY